MKNLIAIPALLALALGIAAVASCKQGEGERCQVAADCQDGFICNQATQTCAKTAGGGIDAVVPVIVDAPMEDAPMQDAPVTLDTRD